MSEEMRIIFRFGNIEVIQITEPRLIRLIIQVILEQVVLLERGKNFITMLNQIEVNFLLTKS